MALTKSHPLLVSCFFHMLVNGAALLARAAPFRERQQAIFMQL
jgi:hypothetical protein